MPFMFPKVKMREDWRKRLYVDKRCSLLTLFFFCLFTGHNARKWSARHLCILQLLQFLWNQADYERKNWELFRTFQLIREHSIRSYLRSDYSLKFMLKPYLNCLCLFFRCTSNGQIWWLTCRVWVEVEEYLQHSWKAPNSRGILIQKVKLTMIEVY